MIYHIAGNFRGNYIFVKSRREAPKLIFVILIVVTGSPVLTYGTLCTFNFNHTPLGQLHVAPELACSRHPSSSFIIAMQRFSIDFCVCEGITFIVKLVFMYSFLVNDCADPFAKCCCRLTTPAETH